VAQGGIRLELAVGAELHERGRAVQIRKNCGFALQPSAAYLLAAPSVPDEAREKAVEKAEAGEEITFATAKEIVAEVRKKKRPSRPKTMPAEKLAGRLVTVLERYRDRWNPKELAELVRQLRELADSLDAQKGGKRTKKE